MMDEANRRHNVSGSGKKRSCGESPFAASTSCNQSADACNKIQRMDHQAVDCEYVSTPVKDSDAKKKRVPKITGGGLRQFSLIVCKKLQSKGRTTYNEVADEIIAELATESNTAAALNELDEKNIRRRVYDALNVLMAMDIITKEKKEIHWRGLPSTDTEDTEELKSSLLSLRMRFGDSVARKAAYLKEVEEQIAGIQNLMVRNQQMFEYGKAPTEGIRLPFMLVQTSSNATVEIEMSDNSKWVHLDCNSTPFFLYDDAQILELMEQYKLLEK